MHYEKIYLDITVMFTADGKIVPQSFLWEGESVEIDKVVGNTKAAPLYTGSFLTERYTCLVYGKERFLYFEPRSSRWFVEARCAD